MEKHKCTKCLRELDRTPANFGECNLAADGMLGACRECVEAARMARRKAAREKKKERGRAYYHAHKEEFRARQLEYNKTRREQNARHSRRWRKKNPEKVKAYQARAALKAKTVGGNYTTSTRRRASCILAGLKYQAIRDKVPFDADFFTTDRLSEMLDSQPLCSCCSTAFVVGKPGGSPQSVSVARVLPSVGFVEHNLTLLCKTCHDMKRKLEPAEVRKVSAWLAVEQVSAVAALTARLIHPSEKQRPQQAEHPPSEEQKS